MTVPKPDDRRQETVKAKAAGHATIRDVEDLHVYQKAFALSMEVHRASVGFPRHEQAELAAQMRRASKSICANLAEGFGRQSVSKPEFKRFVLMAMSSADEMRVWVRYCQELQYLPAREAARWREEYQNIARMLMGLHRNWG